MDKHLTANKSASNNILQVGGNDNKKQQSPEMALCHDVLHLLVQYCYMNIVRRSNALAAQRKDYNNVLLARDSAEERNLWWPLALVCRSWREAVAKFVQGPEYIAYYERRCLLSPVIKPRRFILVPSISNKIFFGQAFINEHRVQYSVCWADFRHEFPVRDRRKITATFVAEDIFRPTVITFTSKTEAEVAILEYKNTKNSIWTCAVKCCKCCKNYEHVISVDINAGIINNANASITSQCRDLYRAVSIILRSTPEFRYVFNVMFDAAPMIAEMSNVDFSADDKSMNTLAAILISPST
jgi:hypothetical protein